MQKHSAPLQVAWVTQAAIPRGLAKQSSLMHALPPPEDSRGRAESHLSPHDGSRYSEDVVAVAARVSGDSDASDVSEWDEELEAAAAAGGGGADGEDSKGSEKGYAQRPERFVAKPAHAL